MSTEGNLAMKYTVRSASGALVHEGDLATALEYVDADRFKRGWTVVHSHHVIKSMELMNLIAAGAMAGSGVEHG